MLRTFRDDTTRDIFDGTNTKAYRRVPLDIHPVAHRKLDLLNGAAILGDLRVPPGNRLEDLKGDLKGFHSIRVNDQWRIVFRWVDNGADDVQIQDYH